MKHIAYKKNAEGDLPAGHIVNVSDTDWSDEVKTSNAARYGFGTYDGEVVVGDVVVLENGAATLDADGHLQLVQPELATRDGLIHIANGFFNDAHIGDILRLRMAIHNFRAARKILAQLPAGDPDTAKYTAEMMEACADLQAARRHSTPAHYYRGTLDAIVGKIRLENETAAGQKIAARVAAFHNAYKGDGNVSDAERDTAEAALKTLYGGMTETRFLSDEDVETAEAARLIAANERITITAPPHVRLFITEFRLVDGVEAQVGEVYDIKQNESQSFDSGWTKLKITLLNAESDNLANPIFSVVSVGFDKADFRFSIAGAAATATFPTLADGNNSAEIVITQAA